MKMWSITISMENDQTNFLKLEVHFPYLEMCHQIIYAT